LYTQLRSVALDKGRVYHIRDAALDRNSLHILLQDGEIAFTADICGRITGAFFVGDGEVLLRPPNKIERASLALFTGMAILEEQFTTAYIRFNDETFDELKPALRPIEGAELSAVWRNGFAVGGQRRAAAVVDFSQFLPGTAPSRRSSRFPADCCMRDYRAESLVRLIFTTTRRCRISSGSPN
jgi:hypothetical protein